MYVADQYGFAFFSTPEAPLVFTEPVAVEQAMRVEDVLPALERVGAAVESGLWAAGFLAYEAAPAFDTALRAHAPQAGLPLLWFGLHDGPARGLQIEERPWHAGPWEARVSEAAYRDAVARIREHIAAGDTYQVNYAFPMRAPFSGDAFAWFLHLRRAQQTPYGAFLHAGRHRILSLSPELFFDISGERLTTRPMKGTRPRGRWPQEDRDLAAEMRASAKEQAENVMIVDLLRNDMGRISLPGSVRVERLFEAERYETVWQMTSTVTSRTVAPMPRILEALFPCGSVTGAPKVYTSGIIRAVEPHPRGVYCGAVGWWAPGRRACFNVAIRTVTVDTESGRASYYVGSGVTWDSEAENEYAECLAKAAVLRQARPDFELLETLRWDGGFALLEEHIERLAASAGYFDFVVDRGRVVAALESAVRDARNPVCVRLLLSRGGEPRVETRALDAPRAFRVALASAPVCSRDVFLFHKTTHRAVYEAARAARPDCDDVLLWNERGELTESTIANVVVERDGELITPPVPCGLLPGTMRARLLAESRIREARVLKEELRRAGRIRLINSLRGWIDATLID